MTEPQTAPVWRKLEFSTVQEALREAEALVAAAQHGTLDSAGLSRRQTAPADAARRQRVPHILLAER